VGVKMDGGGEKWEEVEQGAVFPHPAGP